MSSHDQISRSRYSQFTTQWKEFERLTRFVVLFSTALESQSLGILEASLVTATANGTDKTFEGCMGEGFYNLIEIVLVIIYQFCDFP